jgi:hypothetical protein
MSDRMTRAEAVALCRLAKAFCPNQQIDEYTPDAWWESLKDLRFEDAREAVVSVTKRQPFVSPSEIRADVRRVRYNRVDKFGHIEPPPGMWDDPAGEAAAIHAIRQRVADGTLTREQYDAERAAQGLTGKREMPALEGVFRRVNCKWIASEPAPHRHGPSRQRLPRARTAPDAACPAPSGTVASAGAFTLTERALSAWPWCVPTCTRSRPCAARCPPRPHIEA